MNFDVNFPENNIHFTVEMEQLVEREICEKNICQNGVYNAEKRSVVIKKYNKNRFLNFIDVS